MTTTLAEMKAEINTRCIVNGKLHDVKVTGYTITEIQDAITAEDADAKFEESFFYSKGGYSKKDTKLARVQSITCRKANGGVFIEFVAESGGDDVTIKVGKKRTEEFPKCIIDLGILSDKTLSKIESAFDKPQGACIFPESDQFGINYFSNDDGTLYLDSLTKELPSES